MTTYELGGVKFIIHEGEVYCRYKDVFEEEDDSADGPVEAAEEDPFVRPPIKFNTGDAPAPEKKTRGPRTCKVCGGQGHNKKTCPEAGMTDYAKSVYTKQKEEPKAIADEIEDLARTRCSLDEVLLTYPSEPAAIISQLYFAAMKKMRDEDS